MTVIVDKISKYYGKQKALNEVSFTLREGEICGFLGPNGAGKSTMMKVITGYLDSFTGNVSVCGTDIRSSPLKAKALLGYLPEQNPLYPDMYIKEYLLHVARLYGMKDTEKRVESVIELTGLIPERSKKIGQLSKGYRQRVGLAQALVHDPEVLILDEPMTGLDPNQLDEIRQLIIYTGKAKTVLLSTHVMQEVEAICDRIIIINQGTIVADRSRSEFHSGTGGDGEMEIKIAFAGKADASWLKTIPGICHIRETGGNAWQLTATSGNDPRIDLFNAAAANNCPIIRLETEERSLEKVFRELTEPSS